MEYSGAIGVVKLISIGCSPFTVAGITFASLLNSGTLSEVNTDSSSSVSSADSWSLSVKTSEVSSDTSSIFPEVNSPANIGCHWKSGKFSITGRQICAKMFLDNKILLK